MMGFHVCEYCQKETSSGDVVLNFKNGHSYIIPDMILHYIADHDYVPPPEFCEDILYSEPGEGERHQTKSIEVRVGYLSGEFPRVYGNGKLFMRLWSLMRKAEKLGNRHQTRGMR